MFYNREEEKKRLKNAIIQKDARLLIIYGRRRCGKSTLIKHILTKKDVYFVATLSDAAIQRQELAKTITYVIPGFDQAIYPTWEGLFTALHNASKSLFILCLDEFPYLVKTSPELPSILQRFIDNHKNRKFHIILCGSSQQMMQGFILDSTSPLYGRANDVLKIQPLLPYWLTKALDCDSIQAIEEFSVWGGVPRYWEIRQQYKTLEDAIKGALLDRYGILHEEPSRLFLDDMRESVQAFSILTVVGQGANRLSEIGSRLNKPSTHLSRPIDNLINLGYLKREIPFGESYKSSKHSIYKIAEPFMNFYYTFVIPNLSRLELGKIKPVYNYISQQLNMYVSKQWEELCRQAIPFIKIEGKDFRMGSRWWAATKHQPQEEIDIIAESEDKTTLLFGECKWSHKINLEQVINKLKENAANLKLDRNKKVIYRVFVKQISDNKKRQQVITPEQILQVLK